MVDHMSDKLLCMVTWRCKSVVDLLSVVRIGFVCLLGVLYGGCGNHYIG